jgi:hypothetical protein
MRNETIALHAGHEAKSIALYGTTHTFSSRPGVTHTFSSRPGVRLTETYQIAATELLIDSWTRAAPSESVNNICDVAAEACVAHGHGVPLIFRTPLRNHLDIYTDEQLEAIRSDTSSDRTASGLVILALVAPLLGGWQAIAVRIYRNFSPCPMGNATIDTSRVYESLEFGCIPLVELRLSLDYYKNLLGPNPLPAFHDWREARQFMERLIRDKSALLAKQTETMDWWKAYKDGLRTEVREAINGASRAQELQRFSGLVRNRFPLVHQPLRIIELLRHQSAGSLWRRLARPSGPLKRILRDSLALQSRARS